MVGPSVLAFEGRILMPDGAPAADATVTVLGRSGHTRTDAQGRFTWVPDPPVPFELLVSLPGGRLAAPVRVASIPDGEPLQVTLSPLAAEEITVTAAAAPHIEAPPAGALSLLAREDLEERHPQRLSDALENVAGVSRLGQGHDAVPSIRGLARGRTLILLDGARVSSERRAGASATFLDPFFLEAVEVSRGPGSVAYGSDAFGGVIHARTRRATPGEPWTLRFEGSLGEGVPQGGAGVELRRGLSEGGVVLQARYRSLGDYRSPAGDVPNSSAESERGLLGRLDHEAGPGRLSVGWQSDAARGMERPSADVDVLRITQPREESDRLTLAYQMDPLPASTLLSFSGFLGRHRLLTEQDLLDATTMTRRTDASDVRAKDYDLRAQAIQPLGGTRSRLEAGLDLNGRFDLEAIAAAPGERIVSVRDAARDDAGAYVTGEVSLHRALSGSAGLRYDRVRTRNHGGLQGDAATRDAAVSGFAALTAGPFRGVTLTGQIARGFRDPTLSDRYFTGPTGRGVATGNPDLEAETSRQLDAAVRFTGERLRWALYGYRYVIEDLVERFRSGTDAQGRVLFFFRNRGEAILQGVELEATLQLDHGLRFELAAQTARGEADDDSPLDDAPGPGVTLVARKSYHGRGHLLARAALLGEDDRSGPTEVPLPGRGTLDLGGGWRLGSRLELRLLLRNVLDHQHPASPEETAVPAPGRSVLLSVGGSLGQ